MHWILEINAENWFAFDVADEMLRYESRELSIADFNRHRSPN